MGVEDVLKEIREEVKKEIPATVEITDIEFEAAVLVIYTKHPERFAADEDLVRRPAKKIRELVPAEAEITELYFEPDIGEVMIEARKPGLVIGRHGTTLNDIKKAIGWAPKVVRTPPIPSKTVKDLREYLRTVSEERKELLHR